MIFNSIFRHEKLGALSWNKTPSKFLLGKNFFKYKNWPKIQELVSALVSTWNSKNFPSTQNSTTSSANSDSKREEPVSRRKFYRSFDFSKMSIFMPIFRWCWHSLRRWYVRYFQCWSSWFLWTFIGPNGCRWC